MLLDYQPNFNFVLPAVSEIRSNTCMTITRNPRLWTVWLDYFATGEGRTMMAVIGYASNEDEAKALFFKQFGEWFALGCEAGVGIVHNPVIQYLFSPVALQTMTQSEGLANIVAHASVHLNAS